MPSKEDVTTNLVERLDWRVARRDESRIARRLWKQQAVLLSSQPPRCSTSSPISA